MNREQALWVATNVTEALGNCAEATARMAAAFPDLTRVRGHYICPVWGRREHWWLTSPAGATIDPTAGQFPSGGLGEYEPRDEGVEEPAGKCLNCGGYCFPSSQAHMHACSKACADALRVHFNCR